MAKDYSKYKAKRAAAFREQAALDEKIAETSKKLVLLTYDRKLAEIKTIRRKTDRKKALANLHSFVMGV